MTPETKFSIPLSELKDWIKHIDKGMQPEIKYSDDPVQMQKDAYDIRGNMLCYLNHRIRSWIGTH